MKDLVEQKANFTRSKNSDYKANPKENKIINSKHIENMHEIISINHSNFHSFFDNLKRNMNISVLIKNKFMDLNEYNYIISNFCNTIKKLAPNSNITEEEIKLYLLDFIKKCKIHIISMQNSICNIILLNGNIYIDKKYLENMNENNYPQYITCLSLALFHELAHEFLKLLKDTNYYLNNKYEKKNNDNNDNNDKKTNNNIKFFGSIYYEELGKRIKCH